MNRITRTVVQLSAAAGIAVAITLTSTPAHADGTTPGGGIVLGPIVDPDGPQLGNPTPAPDPLPVPPEPKQPRPNTPKGPGDLQDLPSCTHGCGGSDAPKDLVDAPAPAAEPDQDQGCFTGCDLPEEPTGEVTSIAIPGAAGTDADETVSDAPAADEDGGALGTTIWAAAATALLTLLALLALLALALAAVRRRRTDPV